jgi:MFS family permease
VTQAAVTARPPGGASARRGITLAVVSAANFLVLSDATIVNVALPTIKTALGFSAMTLPWVVNGYTFAFGGCLLLGGRAADLLGPKRVFTGGMTLFALGSLECGLAGSATMLVAGRVIQGLGGALACPAALSVITVTFPEPGERVRALAGWSAAGASAVAVGPMIGGALTAGPGWASVFWVPVPICLAAALAGLRSLPRLRGPRGESRASGVSAFPLRRAAAADVVLALTSAALVGACYACTLWMQGILRYGPFQTGLAFLPLSMGIVTGSVVAPALIRRIGLRPAAITGLAVSVVAMALLSHTPAQARLPHLLPWLALLAIGFGIQSVPVSVVATAVPGREALASAVYQTAGQLGGGVGLAVMAGLATGTAGAAGAHDSAAALAVGYDAAFAGGAVALAAAGIVTLVAL